MGAVSSGGQNLGVFQSDYPAIVAAAKVARMRRIVGKYTLLDHADDPEFPKEAKNKKLFYCCSEKPFVVSVALRGKKGDWQTEAERFIFQLLTRVEGVVKPLLVELGINYQYIVLDLYKEGDLFSFLERYENKLEPWQKSWICYSLVKVVMECHELKIVLRDLKSDNVLMSTSASGIVESKLTDFGMAIYLPISTEAEKTKYCGSLTRFSPEMFAQIVENNQIPTADFARDLWALGTLLYEVQTVSDYVYFKDVERFKETREIPPFPSLAGQDLGPFSCEIQDLLNALPSERPPAAWIVKRMADIFLCTFPNSPVESRVKMRPKLTFEQVIESLKTVRAKFGERMFDKVNSYLEG